MRGWMGSRKKKRENREMLWSGTRCLAGIRSGPHEASLAHTLNKKGSVQQQRTLLQGEFHTDVFSSIAYIIK